MSDELWRESLAAFRAALAADAPTPGCGAAAAVTADLGLALVVKALRISRRHADSVALAEQLAQAESLLGRLGRFADEDMQAFSDYLQAAQRGDEARDLAARQACAVPLASAHGCLQGLEIAVVARPLVRGALSSDVRAGGLLLHAALSAALLNVDADLAQLSAAQAHRLRAARTRLQQDADRCLAALR